MALRAPHARPTTDPAGSFLLRLMHGKHLADRIRYRSHEAVVLLSLSIRNQFVDLADLQRSRIAVIANTDDKSLRSRICHDR